MRFIKKHDCWLDTKTGLEWELSQSEEKMSYNNSMKYCKNLGKVWRLPTDKELESIVDQSKSDPATELSGIKSSSYWSTTTGAYSAGGAWGVGFGYCGVNYDYNKYCALYVRAVRGGQKKKDY